MIRAWIESHWGRIGQAQAAAVSPTVTRPTGTVPAKYAALHKYLKERYADGVTLTFEQIEDVLGSELPALARAQPEWWTATNVESGSGAQAQAWSLAGRTAEPNLGAQNVRFERGPSIS